MDIRGLVFGNFQDWCHKDKFWLLLRQSCIFSHAVEYTVFVSKEALRRIKLCYHSRIKYHDPETPQQNDWLFDRLTNWWCDWMTVSNTKQHNRLETILYGDDDLDYESNFAIILAVHEFIKDSERFWLCILCLYFTITSYWLYLPCEIYYAWEFLLLDSCDYWIVFTCLRMYGVILVTLVWVCCVNVSMIDYLCSYNCICCMREGFNIASVLCPIPFHVNEIKYV